MSDRGQGRHFETSIVPADVDVVSGLRRRETLTPSARIAEEYEAGKRRGNIWNGIYNTLYTTCGLRNLSVLPPIAHAIEKSDGEEAARLLVHEGISRERALSLVYNSARRGEHAGGLDARSHGANLIGATLFAEYEEQLRQQELGYTGRFFERVRGSWNEHRRAVQTAQARTEVAQAGLPFRQVVQVARAQIAVIPESVAIHYPTPIEMQARAAAQTEINRARFEALIVRAREQTAQPKVVLEREQSIEPQLQEIITFAQVSIREINQTLVSNRTVQGLARIRELRAAIAERIDEYLTQNGNITAAA